MLPARPVKTKLPASSEREQKKLKAEVFILNSSIWVHPRASVPIRLFLWGGAPPILFLLEIPNLLCDLPCGVF